MRVSINTSVMTTALIAMAAISLVSLIGLNQLDQLVHVQLYNFGLRFSNLWALPYWAYSGIIIGLSWFNIAATIGLFYHLFRNRQPTYDEEAESFDVAIIEDRGQHQLFEYVEINPSKLPGPRSGRSSVRKFDVTHPDEIVDCQC